MEFMLERISKGHLSHLFCSQVAQDHNYSSSEYLQGWTFNSLLSHMFLCLPGVLGKKIKIIQKWEYKHRNHKHPLCLLQNLYYRLCSLCTSEKGLASSSCFFYSYLIGLCGNQLLDPIFPMLNKPNSCRFSS